MEEKMLEQHGVVELDDAKQDLDAVIAFAHKYCTPILITKNDEEIAEIRPVTKEDMSMWGCMKGTVEINGDLLEPWTPEDYFYAPEKNIT